MKKININKKTLIIISAVITALITFFIVRKRYGISWDDYVTKTKKEKLQKEREQLTNDMLYYNVLTLSIDYGNIRRGESYRVADYKYFVASLNNVAAEVATANMEHLDNISIILSGYNVLNLVRFMRANIPLSTSMVEPIQTQALKETLDQYINILENH